MESKKRTLVKTAVYRGSITLLLFVLLWAFTDDVYQTSMITLVFNVTATIIYYFHERIWSKINWGNLVTPPQKLKGVIFEGTEKTFSGD